MALRPKDRKRFNRFETSVRKLSLQQAEVMLETYNSAKVKDMTLYGFAKLHLLNDYVRTLKSFQLNTSETATLETKKKRIKEIIIYL